MSISSVKDEINKIIKPIFSKVLQETSCNSMTITQNPIKILWRPNNYRRQIRVKIKDNSTIKKVKSAIPFTTVNGHTKLVNIKYRNGITLQYGKHTLTGIFSQNIINGVKETYLIEANCIEDLNTRIEQKKEEIKNKIDTAMLEFIKRFRIGLKFEKPKWSRYEDWIKGEQEIDKLPKEIIIHDTVFKKVYEKGIEFKSCEEAPKPITSIKNYIKNRALEQFSPIISKEIAELGQRIDIINPLAALKHNVNSIEDVFKNEDLVRKLKIEEKREFEIFLFDIIAKKL